MAFNPEHGDASAPKLMPILVVNPLEERKRWELLRNGVVWVTGEIDDVLAYQIISSLQWAASLNVTSVTVFLNTYGGNIYDALAIYDSIRALTNVMEINTVAVGNCYSAGVVLLQAGTQRFITPNTYLLIHEVSSWTWGKVSEHEDAAKHLKELQERVFKILTERSRTTVRQLKARSHRRDWWISPEEALRLRFVDGLWRPSPKTWEKSLINEVNEGRGS